MLQCTTTLAYLQKRTQQNAEMQQHKAEKQQTCQLPPISQSSQHQKPRTESSNHNRKLLMLQSKLQGPWHFASASNFIVKVTRGTCDFEQWQQIFSLTHDIFLPPLVNFLLLLASYAVKLYESLLCQFCQFSKLLGLNHPHISHSGTWCLKYDMGK